ncbi:MAG: fibronectin type III domain-containing protein [Defluviitaleaceae bacterium]|nr:fibronectin type III domain-containing protein [Defluviitaleaceae bacterium]
MFESKAMFGNYINLVQEALQKNDFNVARQYLSRAKSANPDEKTKTDQLLLDIEKAEKLYNIANPPKPVENLEISVDNFNWRVTISWSPSQEPGEKNIKYRILRKPGSEIPKNEMDGDIIQDDLEETTYCDINIPPGIQYSYGIFTKRRGGFSGAVGDSVMLLAEIGGLHYEQHEKSDGTQALRISWKTPQNCVGVRIIRINNANGEKKILANNAISLYEDTDLEHSVSYVYLLYAKYFGHPPSAGVRFTTAISPNVKIKPFNIRAEHVRGAKYTIYWKITEPDIDLRIKLNKRTVLRDNLKSDMGNCEIELPLNGNHTIFVEACSSGKWIKSANYIEINTFIPPEIEVKTAEITEIVYHYRGIANGFRVKFPITLVENLENIKNLTGFCYAVRISDEYSRSSHWVAANEINSAPDIIRVSKEQYLKDGKIECEMIIQEQGFFYITFFAVYNQDGKEIISKPCRKKIERPILASVIWKVVKRAFGKPKLILEISANKPAMRHPRFVLCALDAHSKRPWSLNDAKKSGAKILLDIFETNFVSPKKIFYDEYSITEPIGKNKKLFLFGIDLEEGERYTPQWADGFRGEI